MPRDLDVTEQLGYIRLPIVNVLIVVFFFFILNE